MAEIREGYKETEIGIIPEDWEVKKLGEVADVKGGKRIPKGFTLVDEDTGYPYIRVADMNNGGVSLNDIKYVPIEVVEKISKYRISSKDIYISVAGTLGIVGVIPEALENANLTENADKICDIKCNRDFLAYFLRGKYIQKIIDNEKTLGAQPKLALTRIKTFNIALPPIKEQKKIAEILSTTDKHIEDLDRLIEDYELLKKGMMQKLLTEGIGHTEFKDTEIGRIPKEWEVKALEEIANKKIKNSFIDGDWIEKEHLREDGIRLIQTGNIGIGEFVEKEDKKYISEESFRSLNCKEVFKDDILICRMAEPTGRSCIAPDLNKRMITSVDCVILRLDTKIHQLKFVNYFLNSYQGLKYSRLNEQGTTRRRITRKKLSKLPVPIPPLAEQEKMASILSSIDDHINQLKESKDNYTNLKQALMDRLLTGEIRVV